MRKANKLLIYSKLPLLGDLSNEKVDEKVDEKVEIP